MIINNNTLKKLLEEKEVLVNDGRALTGEIEKLEKERAKIGMQIQKRKDKIIPLVEKEVKPKLGEYEDIETVTINKSGEVEVNVFNHLEEFKKAYAEKAVKPLLGEYEDIETVTINKSGEVEVNVFNHLEEFKKAYAEKFDKQAIEEIEKFDKSQA